MISRTKFEIDEKTVEKLFSKAGISGIKSISPLGAGEYNAVYEVIADRAYVIKIAPKDNMPILTYEKDMLNAELFWYSQIREKTDIRVPEIYYSDFSREIIPAAWFIMEKLEGKQRNEIQMGKAEKKTIMPMTAEMLSKIHRIHNNKFGYIQNELYDNWYLALCAMIENLLRDCRKIGKRTRHGEKFLAYVKENRSIFEKAECCMVNYDLWDPNVICRRGENGEIKYAWIDPERCFWGDRVMDMLCLGILQELDEKKPAIDSYNAKAERPIEINREIKIRYAAAQALIGLIMNTEKYYRYTPHHIGWWRNTASAIFFYGKAFRVFKNEK